VSDKESARARKQRREDARLRRREVETAQRTHAARRKRQIKIASITGGTLVGVAAVALAVLLLTSGGGGIKSGGANSNVDSQTTAEVDALLDGIPQNGIVLGFPNAPLTAQYFSDLQCTGCKVMTLNVLSQFIQKTVRAGILKLEYRSLDSATKDIQAFDRQQGAALAAGKQNKLWNFVETFYHQQGKENSGYATEEFVHHIASEIPGLDLNTWAKAYPNNRSLVHELGVDAHMAVRAKFTGAPRS
jgi:hypothetical protein